MHACVSVVRACTDRPMDELSIVRTFFEERSRGCGVEGCVVVCVLFFALPLLCFLFFVVCLFFLICLFFVVGLSSSFLLLS